MLLPISPRAFAVFVALLNWLGVVRRRSHKIANRIETILISHPYSSVGDLVLLLPFLEDIKREWPESAVDIIVGSNASELLEGVTGIRRIFVCGSQNSRFRIFGFYRRFFRNLLFFRREIMAFDYDLAIAPRWGSIMTSEAVYLCYLSGAPIRVGYSATVDNGDAALDALLTHVARGGSNEHESARSLRLLERAGLARPKSVRRTTDGSIQSLLNVASQYAASESKLLSHELNNLQRYGIVSPGATRPFNRWPLTCFANVVRQIHEKYSLIFLIVGGPSDADLCGRLAQLVPEVGISIAGATNLRQLTYLLSNAELFLGMDSGTAHVAGGLGTKTIVVSPFPVSYREDHPNSPVRFRPCGPHVRVLQPLNPLPPCFPTCSWDEAHCITQVSPDEVFHAADELLRSN